MKKNKRKTPEFKKPFLVLNRRKLAGWAVAIFFLCAWMFVLGVLVGRDTAPLKFDIKKLQQGQDDSQQQLPANDQGRILKDAVGVKDKTKLGFYERLPEDQQDTEVPEIKKQLEDNQKTKAAIQPKATESTASTKKPTGPVYTVQAASVKNAKDADQLVAKLKKKGFPAYRTLGKVPEKGIWFRVRIGKYSSRSEAQKTLQKLKKLGLKPILVRQ